MTNKEDKKGGLKGLFKLKGNAKIIAKGFALRSFVGMLPFSGFQWIISAILATFLRFNKTAAIAEIFNTNLATGAFIFKFNYWLVRKIMGIESSFSTPDRVTLGFAKTIIEACQDVFLSLLIGGFIIGIFAMILG
jgi:uncharacterized protein (DUF2062 family)